MIQPTWKTDRVVTVHGLVCDVVNAQPKDLGLRVMGTGG